ncbi:MAG: ethanolamine utilization protein EutN [Candidatus Latescibacterota bacterium]|nr:MAG: ethanolamine utilization protein EutN [Candidatus Latescibacterota bacterium]
MVLAKVDGTVVATRKDEKLEGLKLLVVRVVDLEGKPAGGSFVAVDAVGAGPGEIVLCAQGSSARLTPSTENRPVDAVIVGIIDTVEVGGTITYRKGD